MRRRDCARHRFLWCADGELGTRRAGLQVQQGSAGESQIAILLVRPGLHFSVFFLCTLRLVSRKFNQVSRNAHILVTTVLLRQLTKGPIPLKSFL